MNKKFSFFRDPNVASSGNRFWMSVTDYLSKSENYDPHNYKYIYFNISAPIFVLIKQRLKGKKIILRVDGLYHEKFSEGCYSKLSSIFKVQFKLLEKVFGRGKLLSEYFNFLHHNMKLFPKIILAKKIVYQSEYSHQLYSRYFKFKEYQIINNGSPISPILETENVPSNIIKLVTVYDKYRSSKRIDEIVKFIEWANKKSKAQQFELTILGYDKNHHPKSFTNQIIHTIQTSNFIKTQGRFNSLDELKEIYENQHFYLSFMFRDNCPNVLVESYSLGLPVIAIQSGGIPDIMGKSGIQLNDPTEFTHFSSFDLSFEFPDISYQDVYTTIFNSIEDYTILKEKTKAHFIENLEMNVVAKKYLAVTEN